MPTETTGVVRIRLRIGSDVATATLEDSAAARAFAAMLPTTIRMHDLLGREKPGRLPRQLDIAEARREFDYQVGELAYWPRATTSRSSTPTTARPSPSPAWSAWALSTPGWR